jgi:hypothetical protein
MKDHQHLKYSEEIEADNMRKLHGCWRAGPFQHCIVIKKYSPAIKKGILTSAGEPEYGWKVNYWQLLLKTLSSMDFTTHPEPG